jgi:hypothetical protein
MGMRVATAGPPDDSPERPMSWNPTSGEAWVRLVERYRTPIFHFLRLKWKLPPGEAQDLAANFHTVLRQSSLRRRYPSGWWSFRTHLKRILNNFTPDTTMQKRGGDRDDHPLDDQLPAILGGDPETVFDWSWRMTVLENAVECTRRWFVEHGRDFPIRAFSSAVLDTKKDKSGNDKGSPGDPCIDIVRVKLREMIRSELIQTVLDGDQLHQEYELIIAKSGGKG